MYRKSIWKTVRLHLLFFSIFLCAGYKKTPKIHCTKIQEKTVCYKPLTKATIPPSVKNFPLQKTKQPEIKKTQEKKSNSPSQSKKSTTVVKKGSEKAAPPPPNKPLISCNPNTNKAALKDLAQKILKDSEKWMESLEKTTAVCSEIQKNTLQVDITCKSQDANDSSVVDIMHLIQESLQLPYPGNVQLTLEIFPSGDEILCTIKHTDNESNKNYVLKEIRRISFKEIVKKYNFQKKTVFQIKLIGEMT